MTLAHETSPVETHDAMPAGYDLLHDNGVVVAELGGLACLNRLNSDNDDTMTGGKMDDPYIGDDPTLLADEREVFALQ